MAGVVARYGETGASPYLMPFSVDGLIVVASICLVEIGAQIRTTELSAAGSAPLSTQDGSSSLSSVDDATIARPEAVRVNGYAIGSGVAR